jgi:hypothetical protein
MMAAEFSDKPWPLNYGEVVTPAPVTPTAPEPFTVPPWTEEERRQAAQAAEEPVPEVSAIEEMFTRARALGETDFPEATFGGYAHVEPIDRHLDIPPPDWESEEKAVAQRIRGEKLESARQLLAEAESEEES